MRCRTRAYRCDQSSRQHSRSTLATVPRPGGRCDRDHGGWMAPRPARQGIRGDSAGTVLVSPTNVHSILPGFGMKRVGCHFPKESQRGVRWTSSRTASCATLACAATID